MSTSSGETASPRFGSVEELNTKYSKLASEYSKLRSQYAVIKKAVIEEKRAREESGEILRTKELALRKAEAEMDSLEFRNNQLTKRIELLLSETPPAEIYQTSSHLSHEEDNVLSEELLHKIKENEELQVTLDGIHGEYAMKNVDFENRISELESELLKVRRSESQLIQMVNGLKEDKMTVCERNKSLEAEVRRLESSSGPPKGPSAMPSNYNYPPCTPTDIRVQTVELLGSLGEQIQEFVASSSDFHTYWERRLVGGGSPELSKLLKANVESLKPLELSFQALLSDALDKDAPPTSGIHHLASAFHDYVKYYQKLESLFTFQLEEGSQSEEKHRVSRYLRSYGSSLYETSLKLNEFATNIHSESGLENLLICVSNLHREALELSRSFVSLMESERRSSPESVRNNNTCIAAALSNLSSGLNALSRILLDNLPRMGFLLKASPPTSGKKPESPEPSTPSEMDHLREEIKNVKKLAEQFEKELKKNQQSKEHWKLEFELLEMKYGKLKEEKKMMGSSEEEEGVLPDEELKSLYMSRVDELVSEKLLADSKATSFYLESLTLGKRLKCLENYKKRMEREIYSIREDKERLSEEMNTTSSNYELQLSIMSEHLADMNMKLSSQTDEIHLLKYELGQVGKSSKGGKR